MKARKLSAVLLTLGALVAGTVLIAGTANAAPPTPTTPYPDVAIDAKQCKALAIKVAIEVLTYNQAVTDYNYAVTDYNKGAGFLSAVRAAQQAADNAAIALNTLKYAQATCQNNAANPNPVDKACVNFALELNRLLDELAITQDLQAVATAAYTDATANFNSGTIGAKEYGQITTVYKKAVLQSALVQQQIDDQRATRPAGCTRGDRPPVAPPPHVPTSTDVPTDTATAAASPSDSAPDTTTPSDTTSGSPAPSDTTSTDPGPIPSAS